MRTPTALELFAMMEEVEPSIDGIAERFRLNGTLPNMEETDDLLHIINILHSLRYRYSEQMNDLSRLLCAAEKTIEDMKAEQAAQTKAEVN